MENICTYKVLYRKNQDYVALYETRNFQTMFLKDYQNIFSDCKGIKVCTKQQLIDIEDQQLTLKDIDENKLKAPISICVVLTEVCNLHCRYCYASNNRSNIQSNVQYEKKIADRLNETENIISIMLTGGEIFTWDNLENFILQLNMDNKIITLATNGTCVIEYLTKHNNLLTLIKNGKIIIEISLDHCRAEINDVFRSQGEKVLETVKYFMTNKIPIRISTVLTQNNLLLLDEFAKYLSNHLIRNWTLLPVIGHLEYACNIEDEKRIVSELKKRYKDKIIISYNRTQKAPYSLFMIDSYGNYYLPGKNGKNDKMILGNVFDMSIEEAWTYVNKKSNIARYIVKE